MRLGDVINDVLFNGKGMRLSYWMKDACVRLHNRELGLIPPYLSIYDVFGATKRYVLSVDEMLSEEWELVGDNYGYVPK